MESDQHSKGTPTGNSSQGQDGGVSAISAADQKEPDARSGTSGNQADALEGQGAPNTEEGHGEGDEASESTVATSSGTAKAENVCQEVRGPANLEESGRNTSEMQYTDTIREDATLKKPSDNRQETSNEQQQQTDENIVVENKQGSSCDSAASRTLSSGATVVANSSSSEPQQKQLETRGLQGSVSDKGDSRTSQVSHTEAHSFLFSLFFLQWFCNPVTR